MIEVRQARAADAEAIASLSTETQALHAGALPELFLPAGPDTFPADGVRVMLDEPGRVVLVACERDVVVGFASALVDQRETTELRYARSFLYVQLMGVRATVRRRGVGRALIDGLRAAALERGVTAVLLDVWAFNSEASAFYEAMGFHLERQIMALDLTTPRQA